MDEVKVIAMSNSVFFSSVYTLEVLGEKEMIEMKLNE